MFNRWLIPILLCGVGTGSAFSQPFALPPGGESGSAAAQIASLPQSGEDVDEYGEALLRGPIHEAYAEQYNQNPVPGVVIDRAPPPPVRELPPEQKLNEANVQWLSGYWFWDDDRGDFVWISGVWRKIPPGQRWLPGYWAQTDGQYQWVAGTWVTTDRAEIEYIAQSPPESLDIGPASYPPSQEHFWIPGCWTWQQSDYIWRPGYWSVGYSDWVWVPERYLWTPRGYLYSAGYWDYPFAGRGTLFAPFWFNQPIYARSGFFYTPRISLLAAALQTHLWVRPGFRHYYFGDFYGANYNRFGFYPWHTFHRGFGSQRGPWGYDPLFAHYHRNFQSRGINYFQQVNNQYNIYVNQRDRRPPRTYREQVAREDSRRSHGGSERTADFGGHRDSRGDWNEGRLGESFGSVVQRERSRYTHVSSEARHRMRSDAAGTPSSSSLRRDAETRSHGHQGIDRGRSVALPTQSGAAGTPSDSREEGRHASARQAIEGRPGRPTSEIRSSGATHRRGSDAGSALASPLAGPPGATPQSGGEPIRQSIPQGFSPQSRRDASAGVRSNFGSPPSSDAPGGSRHATPRSSSNVSPGSRSVPGIAPGGSTFRPQSSAPSSSSGRSMFGSPRSSSSVAPGGASRATPRISSPTVAPPRTSTPSVAPPRTSSQRISPSGIGRPSSAPSIGRPSSAPSIGRPSSAPSGIGRSSGASVGRSSAASRSMPSISSPGGRGGSSMAPSGRDRGGGKPASSGGRGGSGRSGGRGGK